MTPARVAWGAGLVAGIIAAVLRGWWQWSDAAALGLGLIIGATVALGWCVAAALLEEERIS